MPTNDLSLVITNKTIRQRLFEQGITSLFDLAHTPVKTLVEIPGIGKTTAPRIRASAQAFLTHQAVWFKKLPSNTRKQGAILDIRVHPDFNPQIPWGLCVLAPDNHQYHTLHTPHLPPSRITLPDQRTIVAMPNLELVWSTVREHIITNDWKIYYWGKAIKKHVNETAPDDMKTDLASRMNDLHKIAMDSVALPIPSTGLIDTASYLGYTNWLKDHKPYIAHLDFLHWCRNPDRVDLLQQALDYMEINTAAVSRIWWWMITSQGTISSLD